MKSIIPLAFAALNFNLAIAYAQSESIICPTLTKSDVEEIINTGTIATTQGETLADEMGKSRAEVLIDEPSANPFDTYYRMFKEKKYLDQNYFLYVGNVLGGTTFEAKERAKNILLSNNIEVFQGVYSQDSEACIYKQIDAEAGTNYPFKTTAETVVLIAAPGPEGASPFPGSIKR